MALISTMLHVLNRNGKIDREGNTQIPERQRATETNRGRERERETESEVVIERDILSTFG